METFDLQDLRLVGNGQDLDLSDDWARLVVDTDSNGLTSWSIQVDSTSQFLVPDDSSYDATIVTTNGQRFAGTVLCRRASIMVAKDNAIYLEGTSPLHGYGP